MSLAMPLSHTIPNPEALQERANNLTVNSRGDAIGAFNGMERVIVELVPPADSTEAPEAAPTEAAPTEARLLVHFYNEQSLSEIVAAVAADGAIAKQLFTIDGGIRIKGGYLTGEVQVTNVEAGPAPTVLALSVAPIGDYSTYTLSLNRENIDPLFSQLAFKFRPGCFSAECAPEWEPAPAPIEDPTIDYLAKDYDSFRHTLIAAMSQRVPHWRATSEADLDQVLLSLFCAAADELSDFQDRVMQEAYLATLRQRVSLARHARLMDYHIHQGNQASTWLAIILRENATLALPKPDLVDPSRDRPLTVWAGPDDVRDPAAVVFLSRRPLDNPLQLDSLVNQLSLYTWDDALPTLAAGSTQADLLMLSGGPDGPYTPLTEESSARQVESLIRAGEVAALLIQERLNPATGAPPGRNPNKRQRLHLLPEKAAAKRDPVADIWYVEVHWAQADALKYNYCFTVNCLEKEPAEKVEHVSLFYGNLLPVYHGRLAESVFTEPPAAASLVPAPDHQAYYERTERYGTLCRLPAASFAQSHRPVAYQNTPPGGEIAPRSTLSVTVVDDGVADSWDEVIDLVHSDDSAENGDRFMVETDELGRSLLRFGNGTNGRSLPENAQVICRYQVGEGLAGNIGRDKIQQFDAAAYPEIAACWNPFDITDGRSPEPAEEVIRRAPEAYRFRQLRAVTLQDYVKRAEELEEVSRAAARYAWTGSWRTVQIAIDPQGTTVLSADIRARIARYLDAVRLIGEDFEIRPPNFVPLDIQVALCVHPAYWPEDIRFLLAQEFSEGYTPDGRRAFFHPDRWTFGQALYASQILGRVQAVQGVDHVISVAMKRWNAVGSAADAITHLRPNEIIQVRNDPDQQEAGTITFDIRGGRQ